MSFKVKSVAKPQYTNASDKSGDKLCNHCNREGHNEESCYQLIGFPNWWDENKRNGRERGRGGKGSGNRGGRGGRGGARANVVSGGSSIVVDNNSQALHSGATTSNHGIAGVSSEQVQRIMEVLSKPKIKWHGNVNLSWIVDTDASNHVTGNISLMRNITTSENCPVMLPDAQTASSNQYGSVILEGG